MYRNDPDAGIHGAAEWTLRRWKQEEKLAAIDVELKKLKDRGNRRWYVNSEGQTLAVIEGPVEFSMGSPRQRAGSRDSEETLAPQANQPTLRHRHQGGDRGAISTVPEREPEDRTTRNRQI